MLPHLTPVGAMKRAGLDHGYHGRPRQPPFRSPPLLDAYLAGYRSGLAQRHLEIQAGTHHSLFHKVTTSTGKH